MSARVETSLEDSALLRRYAEHGDEAAFGELVRRRIGLVYAVALRHTRGDTHRAEDAVQSVFTDLARKAKALASRPVLAGWLHRSAQFAAAGLVRSELRRQSREQTAYFMEKDAAPDAPPADWAGLRPILDEALGEIDECDRDAVILRFFDARPFAEIGERLQLNENAARMRVQRALDKLQGALARRGIKSTTAAVSLALAPGGASATPAGLAATVTGVALSAAALPSGATLAIMGLTKLQIGIAAAVAAIGASTYLGQARAQAALRREIAATWVDPATVQLVRRENTVLAGQIAEVDLLRGDDVELQSLERQVAEVRNAQRVRDEQAARAQAGAAERERAARAEAMDRAATAEVDRMNREGNALVERYKVLQDQLRDPALSPTARAEIEASVASALEAIKAKQREIQQFVTASRAQIQAVFSGTDRVGKEPGALPAQDNPEQGRLRLGTTPEGQRVSP